MSISLFLTLLVTVLVTRYQAESIIHHNQPFFLYIMLLGTAILAFSIYFVSFDEAALGAEPGDPEPGFLDTACTAFPWFLSLGYILIYGALFMKLWRINRVLQCNRARRKTIGVKKVVWPVLLMLVASIVVLTTWTVVEPYEWERAPIYEEEGESYGQCESPHHKIFISILGLIMGTAIVLTLIMAYKTKDIDRQFSESSWAFTTIVLQTEVLLVGIPILLIVQQQSAEATYICRVMLIWTLSVSTVVLMFGPKLIPLLFPKFVARWNKETLRSSIGTNRGSVRVSGHIASMNTKSTRSSINDGNRNSRMISQTHPAIDFSDNTDQFTQQTMTGTATTDNDFSNRRIDRNDIEDATNTNNDDGDDDYPGIPPTSLHSKASKEQSRKKEEPLERAKSEEVLFSSSIQWHDSTNFNDSSNNPGSAFVHPDMNESMTFGNDDDDDVGGRNGVKAEPDPSDSMLMDASMNFETAVEYEQLPASQAEPIEYKEIPTPGASKTKKSETKQTRERNEKRTSKRDSQTTIQHRN